MINCKVYKSITQLNKHEWNNIVPKGQIFQSYDALHFFEKKGLIEYQPRYFVFTNADREIVAHTTAYLIETDLLIFSKGRLKKLVDRIRKIFPNFLNPNILEVGCPISPGKSIMLRPDVQLPDIADQLAEALRHVARDTKTQLILLRDHYEADQKQFATFERLKFKRIANLPTTELHIKWSTYEDYLMSMRSRYKAKLKRSLKIAGKENYSTLFVADFAEMGDLLAQQWQNVNDFAKEYSREKLTPDFYNYINKGFNGNCRLLQVYQQDVLVAHALIAIDGKILRWLFFGRDRGAIKNDGAYFIVIEQIVKLAIELDMSTVEMGLTSYMTKTEYGAEMVPLHMYIHCRSKILNYIVPRLYQTLNKEVKIQKRNVFYER